MQGGIVGWLNSDNPDIILLKIGTNSQSTTALDTLVNTITTTKPAARLIIAQIMPKYSYEAGIVTYNNYIRDTLVPNYQALGRKVTLVDQYAPFLTNPAVLTSIDHSLFSNGINHPDNDGYDKMAQVWFNGIEALGLGPNTFSRWIDSFPGVGALKAFGDDPDGDGIDNGLESFFGSAPSVFTAGVIPGAKSGNTFTFTHPQNATPVSDVTGAYRWSKRPGDVASRRYHRWRWHHRHLLAVRQYPDRRHHHRHGHGHWHDHQQTVRPGGSDVELKCGQLAGHTGCRESRR